MSTVAILAQGTSLADAFVQAFFACFLNTEEQQKIAGQSCSFTHAEASASLLWIVIPALQIAPAFTCSVASLCQCAGPHVPGFHSLRHETLAHYLLAWGNSSVQPAEHTSTFEQFQSHLASMRSIQWNHLNSPWIVVWFVQSVKISEESCKFLEKL